MKLHYELSVLARSVAYNNLSSASVHVGLSQPQLSRIIARIESELGVTVLDRGVRRKSAWTPMAFQLADAYSNTIHKLERDIQAMVMTGEPTELRAGTLEGLAPLASKHCHSVLSLESVKTLQLDVHDLNKLEEFFLNGDLDLIFSSREPGRKKFRYVRTVGFQSMERAQKGSSGLWVLSTFEYGARRSRGGKSAAERVFVSNSLQVRRSWIREYGGDGNIPSEIFRSRPGKGAHSVFMIGADSLHPVIWERLEAEG